MTLDSPVPAALRARLLDRLGLFGVRTAVQLVRRGVATSAELAEALLALSGFEALHEVLRTEFWNRSQLLKARSALAVLDDVLDHHDVEGATALRHDAEALRAGAHELVEIRVVHALRSGTLVLRGERGEALGRLLGGTGHDVRSRLGLDHEATPTTVRQAAGDAAARWRSEAAHPLSSAAVRAACEAAVRTCEQMLTPVAESRESPDPSAARPVRQ